MANVDVFKCKTCEWVLDVSEAKGGVVECKFCHNKYTLPRQETRGGKLFIFRHGACTVQGAVSQGYRQQLYAAHLSRRIGESLCRLCPL